MSNCICFIPCRNEEGNLSNVLDHVFNQTLPYSEVIIINDASTDRTKEIAHDYSCSLVDLTAKHESYLGRPELATIFNHAFEIIERWELKSDYIMQLGADTLIPEHYNMEMLVRMNINKNLVIAGGVIRGEKQYETHVRGNGRYYQTRFWFDNIERYPINFTWETFPLFIAQYLGFEVKHYPDLIMTPLRPTNYYKGQYGHAMRDLGYFPPYALGRCILSAFMDRRDGINMLINYLTSPYRSQDPEVKHFIRSQQIKRIFHPLESAKLWLSRL